MLLIFIYFGSKPFSFFARLCECNICTPNLTSIMEHDVRTQVIRNRNVWILIPHRLIVNNYTRLFLIINIIVNCMNNIIMSFSLVGLSKIDKILNEYHLQSSCCIVDKYLQKYRSSLNFNLFLISLNKFYFIKT